MRDMLADKLTYIQVQELYVAKGPSAPWERNLLNIIAMLPAIQPLKSTLAIVDKSQSIGMGGQRQDGLVPCMACNADMWVLRLGRRLSLAEVAKLMGHKPEALDVDGVTKTQMVKMFGMALHKGTAGCRRCQFQ